MSETTVAEKTWPVGVHPLLADIARPAAENEQLRADLEEAERAIATLGAGRDVYRARVQAVRELHVVDPNYAPYCQECNVPLPCPTIKAIGDDRG